MAGMTILRTTGAVVMGRRALLNAGLIDELHVDVAPVLLGGGLRLFEDLGASRIELEQIGVVG